MVVLDSGSEARYVRRQGRSLRILAPITLQPSCPLLRLCDGMPGLGPSLNEEEIKLDNEIHTMIKSVRWNQHDKIRTMEFA